MSRDTLPPEDAAGSTPPPPSSLVSPSDDQAASKVNKDKSDSARQRRNRFSWGIGAAIIAFLAVLAAGFVAWGSFDLRTPDNGWWWVALGLAMLALVLLLLVGRNPPGQQDSFGASLLGQAQIMLLLATMVTVALYILNTNTDSWWQRWGHYGALAAGIGAALAFGLGLAYFERDLTAPNNVNPLVDGELQSRFDDLDARVVNYCPLSSQGSSDSTPLNAYDPARQAACAVARRHRDFIAQELGLTETKVPNTGVRWVLQFGYIHIWTRLHAAEVDGCLRRARLPLFTA